MKIYFLSSIPCILTVNGAYFGVTDGFSRFAEVCLSDRLFMQFSPENAQPLSFFLDENIRFTPPNGCAVYRMPDAIAIYAQAFTPTDLTLRPIAQCKGKTATATLYKQGLVYLSISHENGTFITPLDFAFERATLLEENGLFFLSTADRVAVYNQNAERLFDERVHEYHTDGDRLYATLRLLDSLQRTAEGVWHMSENGFQRESYTLKQATENGGLPDGLLAYAFLESVMLGGDILPFLDEELIPKAEQLRGYLGNFTAITPTNTPDICALIYPKGERLFDVKYLKTTLNGDKIADLAYVIP
jgi:hypothetical protein